MVKQRRFKLMLAWGAILTQGLFVAPTLADMIVGFGVGAEKIVNELRPGSAPPYTNQGASSPYVGQQGERNDSSPYAGQPAYQNGTDPAAVIGFGLGVLGGQTIKARREHEYRQNQTVRPQQNPQPKPQQDPIPQQGFSGYSNDNWGTGYRGGTGDGPGPLYDQMP